MVVDPYCAELERTTGSHRFENVLCPDRGRQTVDDIVGFRQYFFFCLEATDNDDRAEDFMLNNFGIVAVLGNHCWLKEEALLQTGNDGTLAARYNVSSCTQGSLHKAFNVIALGGRDERPHIGAFLRGVSDANLLDLAQERLHEGVIYALLHIDAGSRSAVLTTVDITTDYRAISSCFDVGILIDNKGGLAAKFQVDALDAIGTCPHDVLAALSATRDRDHIDLGMAAEGLGDTGTTGDDIEYPRR